MLNTLNFFDFLLSNLFRITKLSNKINIGFHSPFLPVKNGGAIISYYFVNEMQKDNRINLFLIPASNIIKRGLFKNLLYSKLTSNFLDYIIFVNTETDFIKFLKSGGDKSKTILYETLHEPFDCEIQALSQSNKKRFDLIKDIALLINPTKWSNREHINYGKDSVYVPYGIDLDLFKKKSDNPRNKVLFVSRVCYYKGIKQFLEAIPFVLKKHPNILFEIHGIVDNSLQEFYPSIDSRTLISEYKRRFPENLKHEENWYCVEDMPKLYENVLVLVYPSNNEGFGLPIIEAMACEVPVIVLDKPPMNEIILDNKTGFCLPIRKDYKKECNNLAFPYPIDIANKISLLIDHPEEVEKLGKNGRQKVEKEYDIKKNAKKLVDVILNLR